MTIELYKECIFSESNTSNVLYVQGEKELNGEASWFYDRSNGVLGKTMCCRQSVSLTAAVHSSAQHWNHKLVFFLLMHVPIHRWRVNRDQHVKSKAANRKGTTSCCSSQRDDNLFMSGTTPNLQYLPFYCLFYCGKSFGLIVVILLSFYHVAFDIYYFCWGVLTPEFWYKELHFFIIIN